MNKYASIKDCKPINIRLDYNYMMNEFIGDSGIDNKDIEEVIPLAVSAFDKFQATRGTDMTGWAQLPYNQDEIIKEIECFSKEVRDKFDYFVVLGIGGSALGPIAVFQALKHLHFNDLTKEIRNAPKFYVEDNVDPERMQALLDIIEPGKTMFNVISKSGATSETMAQYLIIIDYLKKALGDNIKEQIVITTSKNSGNLIKIANKERYKCFYIPDSVGGRFSQLSPVGLLPASILDINISEILKGAAAMDAACCKPDMKNNPAFAFAVTEYIAYKRGKNISVMMPYADSLKFMSDWYAQLWAESLGKVDFNGTNVGQTPVKAVGVTDQHSQVQLYIEGPNDKTITFLTVEKFRENIEIPLGLEEFPDVSFLCGHTLNELIAVEQFSTAYALATHGRMSKEIIFDEVSANTIGQFIFMMELATAYAGEMLGVNTYNQPGVEAGKNATYAIFNKKGYEDKKKELTNAPKKKSDYIC